MNYPEKLKLVIWDLDDTFWKGTLSEEDVEINARAIEVVKELTRRGIINSICSKNDEKKVLEKLKDIGVDGYFVFNKISWNPKGQQVSVMIDEMGLRPVNCIFIDDNKMNLREVEDAVPGIFVYEPDEILGEILNLNCAKGKDDEAHSRLKQYKNLEKKKDDFVSSTDSNIEFLRKCGIVVEIEFDCEKYIDRILELIERTNQLNYTKNRINPLEMRHFIRRLSHYQSSAGVVKCKDKYGDYGIVGFFLVRKEDQLRGVLEHFVFSCRTMNMGVEAYVFDYLGRPEVEVREPVAYPLGAYSPATWINSGDEIVADGASDEGFLLLGPCHLLQISNFFRTNNNFCQYLKDGSIVKFDCPAFFLATEDEVCNSNFIKSDLSWNINEFRAFHKELPNSKIVILSLEDVLSSNSFVVEGRNFFRYEGNKKCSAKMTSLPMVARVEMLRQVIDFILRTVAKDAKIFLLDSVLNKNTPKHLLQQRLIYSHLIHKYYSNKLTVIDMAAYQNKNIENDGVHLDRVGYYYMSQDILSNNQRLVVEGGSYEGFSDYSSYASNRLSIRNFIWRNFGVNSNVYKFLRFISSRFNL